MTKKRYVWGNNYGDLLKDTTTQKLLTMKDCLKRLNKQEDEIQHWKQIASAALNENNILHNELGIAMEQGYTLSEPYMGYKESVRNTLTKVTKRILEKED